MEELNGYQDAGVNVAELVSGFAVAIAGGDVDVGAMAGGNAAENNALCAGVCIALLAAVVAGYTTYAGDGDPFEGLAVLGAGDDPVSKAIDAATAMGVEWSATQYPEQTAAVLGIMEATGNALDATVTYVDDATGNVVSTHWNQIPEKTRNQLKGTGKIVSLVLPVGSVKALKQLKVARRGPAVPSVMIAGKTCVYSCEIGGITCYVGITDDVVARGQAHLREKGLRFQKSEDYPICPALMRVRWSRH